MVAAEAAVETEVEMKEEEEVAEAPAVVAVEEDRLRVVAATRGKAEAVEWAAEVVVVEWAAEAEEVQWAENLLSLMALSLLAQFHRP